MFKYFIFLSIIFGGCKFSFSQTQASFTMDVKKGCPPLTVQFTNTTPGGIANSYQWNFGDGGSSTAVSPLYTYQISGDYIVTLDGFESGFMPLITGIDSVAVSGVSLTAIPNICLVTVDSTSTKNIVVWEKPSDPGVGAVNVYRESDTSWVFAGSVPMDSLSRFIDNNVIPNDSSYSYRISFTDTCGTESGISAIHTTMHLMAYITPPGNEVNLTWINYSGFSITGTRILRDTTGLGNFAVIDSVAPGMVTYVDSFPPPNAEYIVEVIHPTGCVATKMVENHNSSRSNKTNAAPPGGINLIKDSEDRILVFPNPNKGKFTVMTAEIGLQNLFSERQITSLRIYNILGEIIYQSPDNMHTSLFNLDMRERGKGICFLQIISGERVFNKRILVE